MRNEKRKDRGNESEYFKMVVWKDGVYYVSVAY